MSAPAQAFHDEDVVGKTYDARLARRLVVYVRPYGALVGGALALLVVDGLLQLVPPLLPRQVIDVALPTRDSGLIARSVTLYLLSLVAGLGCAYGETILTSLLGQRVMR